MNTLKGAGAQVNIFQVFLVVQGLFNSHKDVETYKFSYFFWTTLVVDAFLANSMREEILIDMGLIMVQPFKPKNNVASPFCSQGPRCNSEFAMIMVNKESRVVLEAFIRQPP